MRHNTLECILKINSKGLGIAIPEVGERKEIYIEQEHLDTALRGDRVLVEVLKKEKDQLYGKIEKILTQEKREFVGTLEKYKKSKKRDLFLFHPQDDRIHLPILIEKLKTKKAKEDEKVLIGITEWVPIEKEASLKKETRRTKIGYGEVLEVLGKAGVHETEMKAIVRGKGFDLTFKQQITNAAEKIRAQYHTIPKEEIASRRDLRKLATFTIDPVDAKDFDDALSVQKLESGNIEVGIHIADVTFFVEKNSLLDKEASRRGTSIYLVDRTIPMLPEALSNDLCSLKPDEDKLAFSALFEMNEKAEVIKKWFGKTIIRSKKRFTYEEAQVVLDNEKGTYAEELLSIDKLAQIIRKKRIEAGAISFEQDEVRFELDKKGYPIRIYKKERIETNKLIEDFMVLANNEVAHYATKHDKNVEKTFIYRVHDIPNDDKLQELDNLLHALGYSGHAKEKKLSATGVASLLKTMENESHRTLVELATVRSMAKAIYSTKNIGHFGLSLKHYTHFTSPIRRYPDMMVHRALIELLQGKSISSKEWQRYEALSRYSTQMEIAAQQAEWDSIKYKQTQYMEKQIGKVFKGSISGFSKHGMFVRENDTLSEGFVRFREIKGDYFTLDEKRLFAEGDTSKKRYTLGDTIDIKVKSTDVERRQIDYVLI